MKQRVAILISLSLSVLACSTIINGSKQDVSIVSTPPGAEIVVNGNPMGTTPATVGLKRGKEHVIEIKKSGYQTARVTTDKSITGMFWGNILCGGIPGGAVDLITGSAYDVDPENVVVTLTKGSGMIDIRVPVDFGNLEFRDSDGKLVGSLSATWQN